jgi:hypothetical protein
MTLDEFDGTFAITDHNLIPGSLLNYLGERFYNTARLSRVPLAEINQALNEVWQGPGSMEHVKAATRDLRSQRFGKLNSDSSDSEPVQTINDFTEADFTYTPDVVSDAGKEE